MKQKSNLILVVSFILLICLGGLYFASQVWYPFMWFFLVPGISGVLTWIFLERQLILDFLKTKSTRQGLSMGTLLASAMLFLVTINFLGSRYSKTFDFSLTGQYTLSNQSKKIIDNLKKEIEIKFFYQEGIETTDANKKAFARLIQVFQNYSSRIKLEFLEMNSNPTLVKEFSANRPTGEAFVKFGDKKNRIEGTTEQDIVNSFIKVTRDSFKTIGFLSGHGERSFEGENDPKSLSSFKDLLEKSSFKTTSVNILKDGKMLTDIDVLIIAGPLQDLQMNEINVLKDFVSGGKSLMILFENKNSAGLSEFLALFGLGLQNSYVANVINSAMGPVVNLNLPTVAFDFSKESEITIAFDQNKGIQFLQPSHFLVKQDKREIKLDVIVKSPQASVALPELSSSDYTGQPQSYVFAVQASGKLAPANQLTKALFLADVDVISNGQLFQGQNKDFALGMASYLAGENDLIALSPKNPAVTAVILKEPEFSQFFKFMVVGIFLPIPVVFLILSIVIGLRRKHA